MATNLLGLIVNVYSSHMTTFFQSSVYKMPVTYEPEVDSNVEGVENLNETLRETNLGRWFKLFLTPNRYQRARAPLAELMTVEIF